MSVNVRTLLANCNFVRLVAN